MRVYQLVILFTALMLQMAQATTIDPAKRFPGYAPTILESEQKASEVFNEMNIRFRKIFPTQCTARAHTWSFELDRTHQIKTQKVFVFYTQAYHRYYAEKYDRKFIWWFHVSPYILIKNSNNSVEERVMDRAFSDQSQTMKEWTDMFIRSKEPCIENVPFASFEGDVTGYGASYNAQAHCYIVRAPMYDMFPADADHRERGARSELEWDIGQVYFAAKSLGFSDKKGFLRRTGLSN